MHDNRQRDDADLWSTRELALEALATALANEAGVIQDGFAIVAACLAGFEPLERTGAHGRVSALTMLKGRNLALGCYSLMLDGLGQEARALLRLVLEVIERLAWYSDDMTRIDRVLEGKRAKAGAVAREIGSQFQEFRTFLNDTGSHVNVEPASMGHLLDIRADRLVIVQEHRNQVLRHNMFTLDFFVAMLATQGIHCLARVCGPQDALADAHDQWRSRADAVFSDLLTAHALQEQEP